MKLDNLSKEDIELIKGAMLESACSLTSEALECKEVMGNEVYKREMNRANRLVYLVNVLNDKTEYTK